MILKTRLTSEVIPTLPWGCIHIYENYRQIIIGIYLRSQMSVYRTIGPLVSFKRTDFQKCFAMLCINRSNQYVAALLMRVLLVHTICILITN